MRILWTLFNLLLFGHTHPLTHTHVSNWQRSSATHLNLKGHHFTDYQFVANKQDLNQQWPFIPSLSRLPDSPTLDSDRSFSINTEPTTEWQIYIDQHTRAKQKRSTQRTQTFNEIMIRTKMINAKGHLPFSRAFSGPRSRNDDVALSTACSSSGRLQSYSE